jgi:hypothetical protein
MKDAGIAGKSIDLRQQDRCFYPGGQFRSRLALHSSREPATREFGPQVSHRLRGNWRIRVGRPVPR